MQDFQNALYINHIDPTNAVIFDRDWLRREAAAAGLKIYQVMPPSFRGFHWYLLMGPSRPDLQEVPIPDDESPIGREPPPLLRPGAEGIGLGDGN